MDFGSIYTPGKENTMGDALSRINIDNKEWKLNVNVFNILKKAR